MMVLSFDRDPSRRLIDGTSSWLSGFVLNIAAAAAAASPVSHTQWRLQHSKSGDISGQRKCGEGQRLKACVKSSFT